MKSNLFSIFIKSAGVLCILGLMTASLLTGCDTPETTGPTLQNDGSNSTVLPGSDVTCVGNAVAIDWDTPDSYLFASGSYIKLKHHSVLVPTTVGFSICDWDSSGTNLAPKVQVIDANPLTVFLENEAVKLTPEDAGIPANTRNDTRVMVYKRISPSDTWVFHVQTKYHSGTIQYNITQPGSYAVTLGTNIIVDTTWRAIGIITPESGGALDILRSSFSAPPGAVSAPTLISLDITVATPQGLPNGLERVYDFFPEGTTFQIPVTLRVAFEDAGLEVEDTYPGLIKFYYFNPSTNAWEVQPTQVDWENQQFVVQMNHFSRYGFGR